MGMRLRVGTWNIKSGRGAEGHLDPADKTKYLDRIVQTILWKGLDLVVLQEVDVWTRRGGWVHQPRYLAGKLTELSGQRWSFLFAKAFSFGMWAYGNAIISSFPLQQVLRLSLKAHGQVMEPRVFLFARVLPPRHNPVGIGCFHLSLRESVRLQEVAKIKSALSDPFPLHPFLLGGDLNDRREGAVYQKMAGDGFLLEDLGPSEGDSFGSAGYRARIDFLFGHKVAAVTSGIIEAGGTSDHHLVWTECDIQGEYSIS